MVISCSSFALRSYKLQIMIVVAALPFTLDEYFATFYTTGVIFHVQLLVQQQLGSSLTNTALPTVLYMPYLGQYILS